MHFATAAWLLPAAFALHVAEEAPGFTAWARRNASGRYTQRDFVRNNALGLALTLGATAAIARTDSRTAAAGYYTAVLTQQALFNPIFHVGAGLAHRDRVPGDVTAVALFLPVWALLTRLAVRERRLTGRQAGLATAVAGVLHAGAVADQVYFVGSR